MESVSTSSQWQPYQDGSMVGTIGTEGGTIVRDEEYCGRARATLEMCGPTMFAVTAGVYGWMMHTCFVNSEQKGQQQFDAIKKELSSLCSDISAGIPEEVITGEIRRIVAAFHS